MTTDTWKIAFGSIAWTNLGSTFLEYKIWALLSPGTEAGLFVCFWGTVLLCKEHVEGEGKEVVVFIILRPFDIQVCSVSGYGIISSVSQCLELALWFGGDWLHFLPFLCSSHHWQ